MHCVVAFTTDFIYVSVAISLKTGYRLVTEFYRRIFEPKRVGTGGYNLKMFRFLQPVVYQTALPLGGCVTE